MEFICGTELSDICFGLGEEEITSFTCQLAGLESKMMSIVFPASGSLYCAKDSEKVTGRPGIPLKQGERFCIGRRRSRTHVGPSLIRFDDPLS
jgi:hypothetical protein